MIDLATDGEDERARGAVGMKLIDKLLPTKTSPLLQINQGMSIVSHLGIPTETQKPIELPPSSKVSTPATRVIDAAALEIPQKARYLASRNTTPTRLREPLPSSVDTKPDDSVPVSPNAEPPKEGKLSGHDKGNWPW